LNEKKAMVVAGDFALAPAITIEESERRLEAFRAFVARQMIKGEDYGVIPGTAKPTLFKPGAEKLCFFHGLSIEYECTSRLEDWDNGRFAYTYLCSLRDRRTGLVIAQCEGSANSLEKRYRWRYVPEFKATEEEKARAIRKERRRSKAGNEYIMLVLENDDPFSLVNTLQKMAQKRALIGATLHATRASGYFTQDIEDIVEHLPDATLEAGVVPGNGGRQEAKTPHWIENPKVRKRFWRWTREELGLSSDEIHEALGVESVKDFAGTMQDAKEAILTFITRRLAEEKRADVVIHKPVSRKVEVLKGEETEKFRQIIETEAAEELYGE